MPSETLESIFAKCLRNPETGCLEWQGCRHKNGGYGLTYVDGRQVRVHRFVSEQVHGPIPEGKVVRHLCHNPPCCEPEHIKAGTPKENTADMMQAGRNGHLRGEQCPVATFTEATARAILLKASEGMRPFQIAKELSLARRAVADIIRGRTWTHLTGKVLEPSHNRGTRSAKARLDDAKVLRIVALSRSGEIRKAVAAQFGVSISTVQQIMDGRSWGWLTGIPSKREP